MATVNDMFNKALAVYDEISSTGLPDPGKSLDYKLRTPYLADMLQKELWETSNYAKVHAITYTSTGTWQKLTLPTDFMKIEKAIVDDYLPLTNYRLEKDGTANYIFINLPYDCTIRIQYKPIPTNITAMTDSLLLDEVTMQGVAYGLCKYFALTEKNDEVFNYCNAKYQEIMSRKVKVPAQIEDIVDVY